MPREELNPFCLTITVEITQPLTRGTTRQAAAEHLADDLWKYVNTEGWGWGLARVEGVSAWQHPDTTVQS